MTTNIARLFAPAAISVALVGGGVSAAAALAPAAGAAVTRTTMAPVTETGKVVKLVSSKSFTMTVKNKSYLVKIGDMTHVLDGTKAVKFSTLKKGETVTVKGPLDMETISATSVVIGM